MKSGSYSVDLSAEFHLRLARCTHNAAVEMLVDSFQDALLMSLERAKQLAPEMGTTGVDEHRAVVDAIRQRDAATAQRIMTSQLARTAQRLGSDHLPARRGRAEDG